MAKVFFWLGFALLVVFVGEEYFFGSLEKVPLWVDGICFYGGILALVLSGIVVYTKCHWLSFAKKKNDLHHLVDSPWWGKGI